VHLRVEYKTAEDLVHDHDAQFVKGGLLVKTAVPENLTLFEDAELEIVLFDMPAVVIKGQVVQATPGLGVAVAFRLDSCPELLALVAQARKSESVKPQPQPPSSPAAPADAWEKLSHAQKITMALHGTRDQRAMVLRDPDKSLHIHVLKHPRLEGDEIVAIARMQTVAPDVLEMIANHREWSKRSEVALALIRNPKLSVLAAVKLIDKLSAADQRMIAKDPHVRTTVQAAAKKRILGCAAASAGSRAARRRRPRACAADL
jgi:hypothetical protein